MKVFTLPDTRQVHVLLTGDLDFVIEFAQRLRTYNVPFGILPTLDALDHLDMELDVGDPDMDESATDGFVYGEFASNVISDIRTEAGTYTHILDIGVSSLLERKDTIQIAALLNPNATIMSSVLVNTATEMGMLSGVDERIVGITLVPFMITNAKTVDLARGLNTREDHVARATELLTALEYQVETVEDRVGLVQMRILVMLVNEAAFAVMEGVSTPEDIDRAMTLGVNYPLGLLAWADQIGIAVVTLILDGLHREYQQERYRPCVLLKQYMRAGWMGKIAGRGFYLYE